MSLLLLFAGAGTATTAPDPFAGPQKRRGAGKKVRRLPYYFGAEVQWAWPVMGTLHAVGSVSLDVVPVTVDRVSLGWGLKPVVAQPQTPQPPRKLTRFLWAHVQWTAIPEPVLLSRGRVVDDEGEIMAIILSALLDALA